MFEFMHPWYLLLLLLIPLCSWLKGRSGGQPALRFSSLNFAGKLGKQSCSASGRFLPLLFLLGLCLIILALARPRLDESTSETTYSGVDIMLVVDTSGSMEALDMTPSKSDENIFDTVRRRYEAGQPLINRLDAVKTVLEEFIDKRREDRIGLLCFAGLPYTASPMTMNYDWIKKRLTQVDIGQTQDGTAIGDALAEAARQMQDQDEQSESQIIILLTDGDNNAGDIKPELAAEAAKSLGIKVYTIGAGRPGNAPVLQTGFFGRPQLRSMPSSLNETLLTDMAKMTGGQYFRATDLDELTEIYEQIDELEKTEREFKVYAKFEELYHYPLGAGLILLGLVLLLSETRFRKIP